MASLPLLGPYRERLAANPNMALAFANTGWLLGDKVVRLGVGLVVNVWIARALGPSEFGLLSYTLALTGVLSAVATMGLPELLVRDLVREPERAQTIVASALALRLAGALLALILAVATALVARPDEPRAVLLSAMLGAGQFAVAMDVVDQRFQAMSNVRSIVLIRNAVFGLFALLKIAALLLHATVGIFALLITMELITVAASLYWRARHQGLRFGLLHICTVECRRLFHQAWPLLLRLLAIGVYMRLDQVLIGQMLGDRAVGIYAAAGRASEIWHLAPASLLLALAPQLTLRHQRSTVDYENRIVTLFRAFLAVSIMVGIFFSVCSPWIIRELYGSRFIEAAPVLAIHVWAGVFVAFGIVANNWLINMGLIRVALYQALIAASVSIGLNLIMIPVFGIIGAAFSLVVSQCMSGLLLNAVFPATRPLFRLQCRALGLAAAKR
jgi:O-antigen/teichoic acid export membrane protein